MSEAKIEHPMDVRAVWVRFRKNKMALFGAGIVNTLLAIAILAPIISPYDPHDTNHESLRWPNIENLFGTDLLGRDVFSRTIWGARPALLVGLGTSLISTIIGVLIGLLSGYYGGVVDAILMRICELFLVVPAYFLCILVTSTLRTRSVFMIILLLGSIMWPRLSRVVRSEVLSLREREYVKAAKALGARDRRIIFRHLLPNIMASIIVVMTMNISVAILAETSLSFIGVTDPSSVDWGIMLARGRNFMRTAWWLTVFPGLGIFLAVLGFNLVGDGLRDALDPRMRGTI